MVAPRTKKGRPGGADRGGWYSMVAPRTKKGRL